MASILERNKNVKAPKKTREDYAEDALYREVWEEVNRGNRTADRHLHASRCKKRNGDKL